jgi:hypothetical protein
LISSFSVLVFHSFLFLPPSFFIFFFFSVFLCVINCPPISLFVSR